jgi:hypothetical protein
MVYRYQSILNPIQFDDPSLTALGLAKLIAVEHGASLHLLRVVPKLRALGEPKSARTSIRQQRRKRERDFRR